MSIRVEKDAAIAYASSPDQQFPFERRPHLTIEGDNGSMAREKVKKVDPFEAEEETPLNRHTPGHGNILAMMAEGGKAMSEAEGRLHGESISQDHLVASTLPLEHSAIDETGHMDHHRKPIISVHGKDIDEHELDHKSAA